tara:strand:+ start:26191 stop:26406 length:216 start_codon:yes stop_codon:yes gene_type:complete
VCALQLAVNNAIKQYTPVRLGFQRDEKAFVLKIAILIGDSERRHVCEFNKAECELGNFKAFHRDDDWTLYS